MLHAISVDLRHAREALPTFLEYRCPVHLDDSLFRIFISLAVTHNGGCNESVKTSPGMPPQKFWRAQVDSATLVRWLCLEITHGIQEETHRFMSASGRKEGVLENCLDRLAENDCCLGVELHAETDGQSKGTDYIGSSLGCGPIRLTSWHLARQELGQEFEVAGSMDQLRLYTPIWICH